MPLQDVKTKRSARQSTSAALYLPSDLGIIVPSQWADLHRRYRRCDSPEGQLMVAVLAQALVDYRQGTVLERRSAKNWFSRHGEAFDFTCELIGVDPERMRKAILSEPPAAEPDADPVNERRTE